ncbi:hypothetical protein [Hoeflea alexandrii]|uniref:hypothetical protein n=1 Tax=Hoeflea alexandrii TaxID=288436 RepID=UPI0022B06830|nr:hypothetical protein [Hoeflea alexandrii]MCZ4291638.1 hypothetical protein [Hoeflea alexandrii]
MEDHHRQSKSVRFRTIALDECLGLARKLQADGKPWHSHVLSPGCRQNPQPDVYAVVIEDDDAGIAYMAKGDDQFPEVDKDLVRMLHGDDIIDASKLTPDPPASALLDQLRGLQERRIPWHHHMHFPSCVFNPHPGEWAISVEAPGQFFSEAYPSEPVDVLRQVEVMYFSNLDSSS